MITDYKRNQLAKIIKARSFGEGDITLASGKRSTFYFDMKPTMLDSTSAIIISEMILDKLYTVDADYVGGLELGAVPVVSSVVAVSAASDCPINGFIVRKQAKGHGAKKLIEGLTLNESLSGKRVVILEDVTTTGHSAGQVIDLCEELGATVLMVISIVDREDGASEYFTSRNINFESLFKASEFVTKPVIKRSWLAKLLNF